MKVIRTTPITGEIVEVEGEYFTEYERFTSGCWYVRMGESIEPVYNCEEIEKAYQEFKSSKGE